MKKYMKILIAVLLTMAGFAQSSGAADKKGALKLPDESKWIKTIEASCISSARRNNSSSGVRNLEAGCACVAKNIFRLASFEETAQEAKDDLNWANRYYSGAVGQREIQRDPLALFQFISHFGVKCAKNPAFEHDFGPGI